MAFDPQKYRNRWTELQQIIRSVDKGDTRDELEGRALLDLLLEIGSDLSERLSLLREVRSDLERRVGDVKVNMASQTTAELEFIDAVEHLQGVKENAIRLLNALRGQIHATQATQDGDLNDVTEGKGT